jgi:hypothetical protein
VALWRLPLAIRWQPKIILLALLYPRGPTAQELYKKKVPPLIHPTLSPYFCRKVAPWRLPLTIGRQPKIIPCSVLHPETSNCFTHNGTAMRAVFRKTFPLYMSLTFVPFVVLNLQKVSC